MQDAQQAHAVALAAALRASGTDADLALRAEKAKAFFSRAGRSGMQQAIYLGPDDIARGTVRVKNLADRTEREVAFDALARGTPPATA
jgi:histidyl-tRNA synthetase